MLTTSINGRAAPKSQPMEQSLGLESIFKVVDLFKSTLTKCGKGMNNSSVKPLEYGQDYFNARWMEGDKLVNAGFYYNRVKKNIGVKNGKKRIKIILENVSDFYFSFFASSNSVLYRLEINHKEQIRGYIFLSNLTKKEDSNESEN